MEKISCICYFLIAFIILAPIVGLIVYISIPYLTAYLCSIRSPNESIHFEDNEFDYWVKVTRLGVNETLDIVNGHSGASLLDYQLVRPSVLCQLQSSLAGNVTFDSAGPLDISQHLIGTHLFWTGAYFARNASSEFELHYTHDDERAKMTNFPDKQYRGFCKSKDYYEDLFKKQGDTSLFRLVIQVTCDAGDFDGKTLKRTCSKSCLTIVPDEPSLKNFLIYQTAKCKPTLGAEILNVPIYSFDQEELLTFHYGTLTKDSFEAALQGRRHVEKMSPWTIVGYSNAIARAFKSIRYVTDDSRSEMLFWMKGFDDDLSIDSFKAWCPSVTKAMIERVKQDKSANLLLRISDFANVKGDPPCVTIDDGSQPNYYVAYQLGPYIGTMDTSDYIPRGGC